jgi:Zn-dependent protease with chaperone function
MTDTRLSPWKTWLLAALLVLLMLGQGLPHLLSFSFEPPSDQVLPPESLEGFALAESYHRVSELSGLMSSLVKLPLLLLILGSGWAIGVERRWGETPWRWPARLGFLALYWLALKLVKLPSTIANYLQDRAYELTHLLPAEYLQIFLVGLIIPFLMYLIRKLLVYCNMPLMRRHWWWGTVAVLFVLFTILPELITRRQPLDLVAKYAPLEEGALRSELEGIAEQAGRKVNFFTVDSSKRTRQGNVYFGGKIGAEFVIFSDTIVEALSPRELGYILAHELGHHYTQTRMMLIHYGLSLSTSLLMYWLVQRWNGGGMIPPERRLHALMQLALLGTVLSLVSSPLRSALSRWDERVCDRYGLELSEDADAFRRAVLGVARLNLTSYDIPGWAYYIGATHPTVRERLQFIDRWPPDESI